MGSAALCRLHFNGGAVNVARTMRIPLAAAAALAALAASTSAPAQPEDGPVWTRKPSPTDAERYYPRMGGGMGGTAALRCKVTGEGTLSDCVVAAEAPSGYGFGQSALAMAHLYRMRTTSRAGKPVAGATVVTPVSFHLTGGSAAPELNIRPGDAAILVTPASGGRQRVGGVMIPCPSAAEPNRQCAGHSFTWRNRASPGRAAAILAASNQRSGISLIECSAKSDGLLHKCRVGGDATPASTEALLELAKLFRAPAFANDSTPVRSGRILMEVDWSLLHPWVPASGG